MIKVVTFLHSLEVFKLLSNVLSRKKVIYYNIFDLFPLVYMCVDIDFRFFRDKKAENSPLRQKKTYVVVITFFPELCCNWLVFDAYSIPTDDN